MGGGGWWGWGGLGNGPDEASHPAARAARDDLSSPPLVHATSLSLTRTVHHPQSDAHRPPPSPPGHPGPTQALEVRDLLLRNREELTGMLAALDGRYVLPEAGGDLLRDGPGVLPTGERGGGRERVDRQQTAARA